MLLVFITTSILATFEKLILSLGCAMNDKHLRQDEIDTGNIRADRGSSAGSISVYKSHTE
jgi:hypothetical protein